MGVTNAIKEKIYPVNWDTVYILGSYDKYTGKAYLTSWDGDLPTINVVITNCGQNNVPFWNNPVPDGSEIHPVPEGKNWESYAKELGGIRAFGWSMSNVDRIK